VNLVVISDNNPNKLSPPPATIFTSQVSCCAIYKTMNNLLVLIFLLYDNLNCF